MEESPRCDGAAGELVKALAELLGADSVEYLQGGASAFFLIDMTSLGYARLDLNILTVSREATQREQSLEDFRLEQMIREQASAEGLVFRIMLTEKQFGSPRPDTVYLFKSDLERLFTSKQPQVAIFDIIHRYVPLLARANPFNTKREARGAMFVGREEELGKLTSSTNFNSHFLISGARFIGKTSLLVRAHQKLMNNRDTRDRSFLINANSIDDLNSFMHRMAWTLSPRWERRMQAGGTEHLLRLFQERSVNGRRTLLLSFDEADTMLAADALSGWRILKVLQEAVQSRYVRLVFSGFRNVEETLNHPDCPMSALRYFTPIPLKPLVRSDTENLIRRPFEESKIELRQSTDLVGKIWEHTLGFPFIVQFLGERLFELAVSRDPRFIDLADIETILDKGEFDQFLKQFFIWNTLRGSHPVVIERVCAYLYLHRANGSPWQDGDFMKALDDAGFPGLAGMKQVSDALGALRNMRLLRYSRDGYTIGLPMLADVLRRTYPDQEGMLQILMRATT